MFSGYLFTNAQHSMRSILSLYLSGIFFLVSFTSCGQTSITDKKEQDPAQNQPDPCDDPDAAVDCSFVNMPKNLTEKIMIAGKNEPGERLLISGKILKADGKTPYPDVILYAYHTDSKGLYSKKGNETGVQKWHGYLHGWGKTDKNGNFEIHSIRPARYPANTMPAHIHMVVKTGNEPPFYISDFVFKDDSLVNQEYLSSLSNKGGDGVVDLRKNSKNTWSGKRNIILK